MIRQESTIISKREEGEGGIFVSSLKAAVFIACMYQIFLVVVPFSPSAPTPDCKYRPKNVKIQLLTMSDLVLPPTQHPFPHSSD